MAEPAEDAAAREHALEGNAPRAETGVAEESGGDDANGASAAAADGEEVDHRVLVCGQCGGCTALQRQIFPAPLDIFKDAVFTYELDVLDTPCHVYSATNPTDNRFDVLRLAPTVPGIVAFGEATNEHTWFPPHDWRMAMCRYCGSHLGWAFGYSGPPALGRPEFFGVIVTNLSERPFSQVTRFSSDDDSDIDEGGDGYAAPMA